MRRPGGTRGADDVAATAALVDLGLAHGHTDRPDTQPSPEPLADTLADALAKSDPHSRLADEFHRLGHADVSAPDPVRIQLVGR